MSLFNPAIAACPKCGKERHFQLVASVNAARRADLRAAILDGTFQRETCDACGAQFVPQPALTYMDVKRGDWILVEPAEYQENWDRFGQVAREAFERAYGARASPAARELGEGLRTRVVFGWAALREKLRCHDFGLDDVELELLKMAVVRNVSGTPLADDNELRLLDASDSELVLCWLSARSEQVIATVPVPRARYDEIAADIEHWQPLRTEMAGHPFVDMNRMLMA